MPRKDEAEFFHEVLKGNGEAIYLCKSLANVSQVLDDLIDKDKPLSDKDIIKSYWRCLVDIPTNPFYMRHFQQLQPIIQSVFLAWKDTIFLEKKNDHGKNISFVLRDLFMEIIIHCALIIGGYAWVDKVSIKIREHIFEDSLEDYKEDLL